MNAGPAGNSKRPAAKLLCSGRKASRRSPLLRGGASNLHSLEPSYPPAMTTLIIGAGAAGLACARTLHAAGADFLLLDAASTVGGRLATDQHPDGFMLDQGFQIFLTSYPEARRWLGDYRALDLRAFRSGARLHDPATASWLTVRNPLKEGLSALAVVVSSVGTLTDKLRLARLAAGVSLQTDASFFAAPAPSSLAYLRAYGFSERIINLFFRPFFGGVFLDRNLDTNANLLRFTLRQFLTADAALPAAGIGAVGAALAAPLPPGCIRLNAQVERLTGTTVHLASGEKMTADAVVLATDGATADRLLGLSTPAPAAWRATTVAYYAAPVSPQHGDRLLSLQADRRGFVHNLCVPSDVQPAYAPAGQALISVSSHGPAALALSDEALDGRLRAELTVLYPAADVAAWRWLRAYRLPQALPVFGPGAAPTSVAPISPGIWRAGDGDAYPSLNGALARGRQVAEALLAFR